MATANTAIHTANRVSKKLIRFPLIAKGIKEYA